MNLPTKISAVILAAGLLSLLLIKAQLIFQGILLFHHIRSGRALSKTSVHFERLRPEASLRILIAGDSVAFGTGAAKPEESIAGYFGQDFPQAHIRNIAKNGLKVGGLDEQLEQVRPEHFDLAVLIVGANDVVRFTDAKTVGRQTKEAVAKAKDLADYVVLMPEGNVGNAPIFPRWLATPFTNHSRVVRQAMMDNATPAVFIDVFEEYANNRWHKEPDKYYAVDHFHPSGAGYRDWYNAIRAGLALAKIEISQL